MDMTHALSKRLNAPVLVLTDIPLSLPPSESDNFLLSLCLQSSSGLLLAPGTSNLRLILAHSAPPLRYH